MRRPSFKLTSLSFPIPSRVSSGLHEAYSRITLTRLTISYFIFSILHSLFQLVFQIQAFRINDNAHRLFEKVLEDNNARVGEGEGVMIFDERSGNLRWCRSLDTVSCEVVGRAGEANLGASEPSGSLASESGLRPTGTLVSIALPTIPALVSNVTTASPAGIPDPAASPAPVSSLNPGSATVPAVAAPTVTDIDSADSGVESGDDTVSASLPTLRNLAVVQTQANTAIGAAQNIQLDNVIQLNRVVADVPAATAAPAIPVAVGAAPPAPPAPSPTVVAVLPTPTPVVQIQPPPAPQITAAPVLNLNNFRNANTLANLATLTNDIGSGDEDSFDDDDDSGGLRNLNNGNRQQQVNGVRPQQGQRVQVPNSGGNRGGSGSDDESGDDSVGSSNDRRVKRKRTLTKRKNYKMINRDLPPTLYKRSPNPKPEPQSQLLPLLAAVNSPANLNRNRPGSGLASDSGTDSFRSNVNDILDDILDNSFDSADSDRGRSRLARGVADIVKRKKEGKRRLIKKRQLPTGVGRVSGFGSNDSNDDINDVLEDLLDDLIDSDSGRGRNGRSRSRGRGRAGRNPPLGAAANRAVLPVAGRVALPFPGVAKRAQKVKRQVRGSASAGQIAQLGRGGGVGRVSGFRSADDSPGSNDDINDLIEDLLDDLVSNGSGSDRRGRGGVARIVSGVVNRKREGKIRKAKRTAVAGSKRSVAIKGRVVESGFIQRQPVISRQSAKSLKLKRYPGPYASDSIPALFPRQTPANGTVQLDFSCAMALNWPLETLENTKREDIVLINFHLWALGISIVALLNESVVHMVASFITHAVLTGWSGFQIVHTRNFQNKYNNIVVDALCGGVSLIPEYWRDRGRMEIPSLVFNVLALIVSGFLSWRLTKTFNWETFKKTGADRRISRAYKVVLALQILLQLSLFFIVVSMALWIEQLCKRGFAALTPNVDSYKGYYIAVLILIVPWVIAGLKAARHNYRLLMFIFLLFNVVLIVGWGVMFTSVTFQYTFFQWEFFKVMQIVALFLMIGTFATGGWCRVNFGARLDLYLGKTPPEPRTGSPDYIDAFTYNPNSDEKLKDPFADSHRSSILSEESLARKHRSLISEADYENPIYVRAVTYLDGEDTKKADANPFADPTREHSVGSVKDLDGYARPNSLFSMSDETGIADRVGFGSGIPTAVAVYLPSRPNAALKQKTLYDYSRPDSLFSLTSTAPTQNVGTGEASKANGRQGQELVTEKSSPVFAVHIEKVNYPMYQSALPTFAPPAPVPVAAAPSTQTAIVGALNTSVKLANPPASKKIGIAASAKSTLPPLSEQEAFHVIPIAEYRARQVQNQSSGENQSQDLLAPVGKQALRRSQGGLVRGGINNTSRFSDTTQGSFSRISMIKSPNPGSSPDSKTALAPTDTTSSEVEKANDKMLGRASRMTESSTTGTISGASGVGSEMLDLDVEIVRGRPGSLGWSL